MSSVIQSLIQRYKPEIEKQENWLLTSDEQKIQISRLEKIAETFTLMSILMFCSEDKVQKFSQRGMKQSVRSLLQSSSKARKISFNHFKRIIGQSISDELNSNAFFHDLKTEFELNYEEEVDEMTDEGSSLCFEDDDVDYHFFLKEMQTQQKDLNTKKSESIVSQLQQGWEYDSHQKKVMSYLLEIIAPQTQLSYLCQEMGWKLTFNENKASSIQFQVIASVDFAYKKVNQNLIESYVAKQKKMGRSVASFKLLKKIYLSFPDIWDMYEEKRTKKSLIIERNPFNPIKGIQSDILHEKIERISTAAISQYPQKQQQRQKQAYLKDISKFKSELNLLIQQNPGVFVQNVDKLQINGPGSHWKVKGQLIVKTRGEERTFDAVEQHLNSKVAEENIAKSLVTQMYEHYREILQKMVMIKNKKGIKT